MTFLVEVVSQSLINKMTSSNLSIVFGPNLLWPQGKWKMNGWMDGSIDLFWRGFVMIVPKLPSYSMSSGAPANLSAMQHINNFTLLLLDHYDDIFVR